MGVLGLWSEAGHGQGGEGVALIIPRFLLVLLSEAAFLCIFYHVTILYQVFAPESSPYLLWVSLLLQLFTLVPPPNICILPAAGPLPPILGNLRGLREP